MLLAIENYEILPFATIWMDLESIMFNEISEPKKGKYSVITYTWNLKNKTINKMKTNEQISLSKNV